MLLRVIGALLPQIVSRLLDISEAVLMTGSGSDRKTGAASPRLKIAGSSGGMRRCTRTERRCCSEGDEDNEQCRRESAGVLENLVTRPQQLVHDQCELISSTSIGDRGSRIPLL
jgi:hypothetical protein